MERRRSVAVRKTHRNAEKIRKIAQTSKECKRGEGGEGYNTFAAMGRRKIYNILPTIMLLCERALIPPAWLCPRAIFLPCQAARVLGSGWGAAERLIEAYNIYH